MLTSDNLSLSEPKNPQQMLLRERLREYVQEANAPNTRRAYKELAKQAVDAEEGKARIETLNTRRASLDLNSIEVTETEFKNGWHSYPFYDLNRVAQLEEEVQRIADRREAEKAGRERVAGFNQRLETLGRDTLVIDSDGDIYWNGDYVGLRDMDGIDAVEQDIAQSEQEAAEQREVEAKQAKADAENSPFAALLALKGKQCA